MLYGVKHQDPTKYKCFVQQLKESFVPYLHIETGCVALEDL